MTAAAVRWCLLSLLALGALSVQATPRRDTSAQILSTDDALSALIEDEAHVVDMLPAPLVPLSELSQAREAASQVRFREEMPGLSSSFGRPSGHSRQSFTHHAHRFTSDSHSQEKQDALADRGGEPCPEGFGCVYPNGVCCPGGKVCCEIACQATTPPSCGKAPSQIALELARKKMMMEAKQSIAHEAGVKSSSEIGKKQAQEHDQKEKQEKQHKAKMRLEEQAEKKKEQQAESKQKSETTRMEEQQKAAETKEKHAQAEKNRLQEEASKSVVIKPDNYEPKKNTLAAAASRLTFTGKYTYMFWIRPSGFQPQQSNVFTKGGNNGERGPAVYFYPNQLRLHVRSSTDGDANAGVDPSEPLKMHHWTHVTITHEANSLRVFFDGKKVAEAKIAAPVSNAGGLWGSDPWHPEALCTLADWRYFPRIVTEKEIVEATQAKKYQEIKSAESTLMSETQLIRRNHVAAQDAMIKKSTAFTYAFWIKPIGVIHEWASILHKGNTNEQRNIALWFYPGTLRMHVRSGTRRGWNDGADPEQQLKAWEWTHVVMTHKEGELIVYFNGVQVINQNIPQPHTNDGPLYIGDPWYSPAQAYISDVRYVDTVWDVVAIRSAMEQKKYKDPPIKQVEVHAAQFAPAQGRQLLSHEQVGQDLTAYSYTLWIKPTGTNGGWSNVFHKGDSDSQRNLAIWFYPGGTRLHIRSGTRSSWNDGLDPGSSLAMNQWTHVAVVHYHGQMEVFYNGVSQGKEWKWQPNSNTGALRVSNPWYPSAPCQLSDFRLFRGPITKETIDKIYGENKKGN